MLEEKNFRRLMIIVTLAVLVFVLGSYGFYYKNQPSLSDTMLVSEKNKKDVPILPFDAFSMKKEDLMIKFGEGKEGSGKDFENQYIDYEQEWFKRKCNARYYYGIEDRIYQINLYLEKYEIKSVYNELKKMFGDPVEDKFYDESEHIDDRKTYWINNATRYSLLYDNGKPFVKMWLEYYNNPRALPLGKRPTVIQREDNVKSIIKGKTCIVLLIGDKPKYTSRYFKNLYLVLATDEGNIMAKMPKGNDGGLYPEFEIKKVKGKNSILIETDNEYTKWYMAFSYKDGKLENIYSSEKKP